MSHDSLGIRLILYYPLLAFILLGFALLVIPRREFRQLFPEGLAWGFLPSFVFVLIMHGLGFFRYRHAGAFSYLGVPVWLTMAWAPAIMVFLYFKPRVERHLEFGVYAASFSLLSAILDAVLHQLGLLVYYRWSPLARFLVTLVLFYVAGYVHQKYTEDRET